MLRWRDFSVVMQSAMNALNPVLTIGAQFADAIAAHADYSTARVKARSVEVLRLVGIDPVHLRSYPHQLSGGMRQRAMIAMALLFTPDLVIMDEPTSRARRGGAAVADGADQGAAAAVGVRGRCSSPTTCRWSATSPTGCW